MATTEFFDTITLEFDQILGQLSGFACTLEAKERLKNLTPSLSEVAVRRMTRETTDARKMLDHLGAPPLSALSDIPALITLAQRGGMLTPEQFEQLLQFTAACRRMKSYLKRAIPLEIALADAGGALDPLESLTAEIERCIRAGAVDTNASAGLRDVRRRMETTAGQIKQKLERLLSSKKQYLSEGFVAQRSGKYVLPVKREYRSQIPGSVVDTSSSGSTCFIEPASVAELSSTLASLQAQESVEEEKVLYTLSALVDEHAVPIRLNIDAIQTLDFAFAKAKLSAGLDAVPAEVTTQRVLSIQGGRHPLLHKDTCVPLDFTLEAPLRGIVITGPNTGGKTVALKTVGLFVLMAQCGLHLPCKAAKLSLCNAILCDIGDGQSITQNLSTFSAHMTQIVRILSKASGESLVLLDELGSGTDPAEGMGIAVAVLEELRRRGCLLVATTHYPEVKDYAEQAEGFLNARMAFDRESLRPRYRLQIGKAGESHALYIAQRLGLPAPILEHAWRQAYGQPQGESPQTARPREQTPPMPKFSHSAAPSQPPSSPKIQKEKLEHAPGEHAAGFSLGDCVMVSPQKKIGIVCQLADANGDVGVQIQKEKQLINHKRLALTAPAAQMYPPDYDFSIVFDTVANRKARHKMGTAHRPGMQVTVEEPLKKNPPQ